MTIFSSLYRKVMDWARHKYAVYWLAIISFAESSFFLVPPDVMLAPMTLARPEKAWSYASLTTITSVLGGLVGYFIGMFAFSIIEPWLHTFGYTKAYQVAEQWSQKWGFWAILIAGFTPVPYKLFTIASGVLAAPFILFVVGSVIGRAARFFLVAGLMLWGGEAFESKLRKWIDYIGWAAILLVALGWGLLR